MANTSLTVQREQEIVNELNELNGKFQKASRTAVEAGVRMGELLTEVKASVGHGNFLPWVAEHCEFSHMSANRYMSAYVGKLNATLSLTGYETLTELAALAPSQRATPPIAPTAPLKRPPCPGVEGRNPGEWGWDEKSGWCQYKTAEWAREQAGLPPIQPQVRTRSVMQFLQEYISDTTNENRIELLKAIRRLEHPDRGGDGDIVVEINIILEKEN